MQKEIHHLDTIVQHTKYIGVVIPRMELNTLFFICVSRERLVFYASDSEVWKLQNNFKNSF